jgi:hypothetical protein
MDVDPDSLVIRVAVEEVFHRCAVYSARFGGGGIENEIRTSI